MDCSYEGQTTSLLEHVSKQCTPCACDHQLKTADTIGAHSNIVTTPILYSFIVVNHLFETYGTTITIY
ncbi:hypothetical protein [Methanomethylovorans hollandica]|uniref:hypothetical protein n=1 Tax=Methanomethylovorans hollandica TaxID=101192 RepID=UPI0012EA6AAB|nr:hypothetical protein [Methanomethylovorans hollandica]